MMRTVSERISHRGRKGPKNPVTSSIVLEIVRECSARVSRVTVKSQCAVYLAQSSVYINLSFFPLIAKEPSPASPEPRPPLPPTCFLLFHPTDLGSADEKDSYCQCLPSGSGVGSHESGESQAQERRRFDPRRPAMERGKMVPIHAFLQTSHLHTALGSAS